MKKQTDGRRRETAAKVGALTLANAFVFQEQLAAVEKRVKPLRRVLAEKDVIGAFEQHWDFICEKINYVPIFRIAREILLVLPSGTDSEEAVKRLARLALEICAEKAALRHDLMGRIYHWLLHHAKYLGTYYTSVPAATLLLKLALAADRWPVKWDNVEGFRNFKIADLACGTGTLLMAASQAITDNFIRSAARAGKEVTDSALRELHCALMENILHGYDVLPSAVHLTASTLALLAPEIAFRKMQLYCLPLGKMPTVYLGSIEFLNSNVVQTQFDLMGNAPVAGAAAAVTGKGMVASQAPLPELDLCVMNPPFVRSVGGNLLFGSLPLDRSAMQRTLRDLLRSHKDGPVLASSAAGLGSVFTAVADRHIKSGGRLALVLPAALTTGVAWGNTRALIEQKYDLEFVISSHEADHWNFSENTDLSEVLVVARKRAAGGGEGENATAFVNLWLNPKTSADALAVADAILRSEPAEIGDASKPNLAVTPLFVGERRIGEALSIPTVQLRQVPWIGGAFAQTDLVRAAWYLRAGGLWIPGSKQITPLKIVRLIDIATLGPDRRRLWATFKRVDHPPGFPVFWGHNASEILTVKASANAYLIKLAKPKETQTSGYAESLMEQAGNVMIAERLRLNTQRATAVMLEKAALSNVWWPASIKSPDLRHGKVLTLWLNSSLGLLLMAAHRVPTEGSWVSFKKPTLEEMPVLDILALSEKDLARLDETYAQVGSTELKPFANIASDDTRAMIDSAFAQVLGVPSLRPFAETLSREPIITNSPIVPETEVAAGLAVQEQFSLL